MLPKGRERAKGNRKKRKRRLEERVVKRWRESARNQQDERQHGSSVCRQAVGHRRKHTDTKDGKKGGLRLPDFHEARQGGLYTRVQ